MKRQIYSKIDKLKKRFSADQIRQVKYCLGEIRGLKNQYFGYDDDEIEAKIGDYLDETYEIYQKCALRDTGLAEEDFDYIYRVLDSLEGPIQLD